VAETEEVEDAIVVGGIVDEVVMHKVRLVVEDDMLAIELLVVEVDGRFEELLPEDETTVWSVAALDMGGDDEELTARSLPIYGLIQG
jgi:hypothetical protein